MNNEIVTRQNEEKAIEYLAAQRQIYSEAKKLDNIGIIFCYFTISIINHAVVF